MTTLECFKLLSLMAFPMIASLIVWGIQEKLSDMYRKWKKQRTSYSDFDEVICDDEF